MNRPGLLRRMWTGCDRCFHEQYAVLWPTLSRVLNLIAILNVSLFFLTGAVTRGGYYYPVISLAVLAVAELLILLPFGWQARLGFYFAVLGLCLVAAWFLGSSIIYRLHTEGVAR